MRDPGLAEEEHRAEKAVDVVIADIVSFQFGESAPVGQTSDERGVVGRSAPPGRHNLRDPRAGMRRQEGEIGLVLHLLQPVEHERGSGVAVDAEPPQLSQPLGVGGVASVDRELNRVTPGVGAGERRHPPFLAGRGAETVHLDLQVAHGISHLRGRREPVRRAHGEVTGGCRTPSDDHPGNDAEG